MLLRIVAPLALAALFAAEAAAGGPEAPYQAEAVAMELIQRGSDMPALLGGGSRPDAGADAGRYGALVHRDRAHDVQHHPRASGGVPQVVPAPLRRRSGRDLPLVGGAADGISA